MSFYQSKFAEMVPWMMVWLQLYLILFWLSDIDLELEQLSQQKTLPSPSETFSSYPAQPQERLSHLKFESQAERLCGMNPHENCSRDAVLPKTGATFLASEFSLFCRDDSE